MLNTTVRGSTTALRPISLADFKGKTPQRRDRPGYCTCGTKLNSYNLSGFCGACTSPPWGRVRIK